MKFDQAAFEAAFGTQQQLRESDLPEVAFSGRSNVGKSSLLNKLLSRKALARVSSVPGKTVTINFFRVDGCRFVDLPGYGYAKVSEQEKLRWASLMEHYFSSNRDIRLVVQLVDMRHPMTAQDQQMIDFLQQTGIPFLVALTKCDKLNQTERTKMREVHAAALESSGALAVVEFSAVKGDGVSAVRDAIAAAVEQASNE